jgi:hypothetical protein
VIGSLAVGELIEPLMAERDDAGAETAEQLADVGLVEPDDEAVGPSGA